MLNNECITAMPSRLALSSIKEKCIRLFTIQNTVSITAVPIMLNENSCCSDHDKWFVSELL